MVQHPSQTALLFHRQDGVHRSFLDYRTGQKVSLVLYISKVLSVAARFMFIISLSGRRALFAIEDKYPNDEKIVLKKGVSVSFNCSSTYPWWVTFNFLSSPKTFPRHACAWKLPFVNEPCGLSGDDLRMECDMWHSLGDYEVQFDSDMHIVLC